MSSHTQQSVSRFPAIQRDRNVIVDEAVQWAGLEHPVRAAVGTEQTAVSYTETYRNSAKDGPDRKRILLAIELQKSDATLTGAEADAIVASILARCEQAAGVKLLSYRHPACTDSPAAASPTTPPVGAVSLVPFLSGWRKSNARRDPDLLRARIECSIPALGTIPRVVSSVLDGGGCTSRAGGCAH